MARIITYSILFFLFAIKAIAQDSTILELKPLKQLKGSISNFTVDNLGNLYVIVNDNQLKKYNAQLDSVGVFNDVKRFGTISFIDASNPFKILLFYKEYAIIVMLDRQLSVKNIIDLRQIGLPLVKTIALSYDNAIWLYDEQNAQIKKIDDAGKILQESIDLRVVLGNSFTIPNTIIDYNKTLYLYNAKEGWQLFDYYGGFKARYALLGWKDVYCFDQFVYGRMREYIVYAMPPFTQQVVIPLHISILNQQILKMVISVNGVFYFSTKEGILTFEIAHKLDIK